MIAGGETGPGARPAHPEWFRPVRDQCQAAAVPFFKGWGDWGPEYLHEAKAWHMESFTPTANGLMIVYALMEKKRYTVLERRKQAACSTAANTTNFRS